MALFLPFLHDSFSFIAFRFDFIIDGIAFFFLSFSSCAVMRATFFFLSLMHWLAIGTVLCSVTFI